MAFHGYGPCRNTPALSNTSRACPEERRSPAPTAGCTVGNASAPPTRRARHNYIGHNYIGHNYIGHNYIGRPCVGPTDATSTGAVCAREDDDPRAGCAAAADSLVCFGRRGGMAHVCVYTEEAAVIPCSRYN